MRMINNKTVTISLLLTILLLTSCFSDFHTADISLYGIELDEVQANGASAFFLSKEGVLYSPGADSDAGVYVLYQNPKEGIIAENVKSFGILEGGGYYVDRNSDLYIWNRQELPHFGYNAKKKHMKVLDGVAFALLGTHEAIFIDENSDLYLFGSLGEESYSIDDPKLLANDVVCADICTSSILWVYSDGTIGSYGEADAAMLTELNAEFSDSSITQIESTVDYVGILSDNEFWLYGDYQKLITGEESGTIGLTKLADGIESFSLSNRTVAAVDGDGNAFLWGRCLVNDSDVTEEADFEYCEKVCWAENAVKVYVNGGVYCYIDENGTSNIYHSGGWTDFYGNSTDDKYVGINREPNRWVD